MMSHLRHQQTSLERVCPNCKSTYIPTLMAENPEGVRKWRNGELIQNVFPYSSEMDREQLLTGICSNECWDQYLGIE